MRGGYLGPGEETRWKSSLFLVGMDSNIKCLSCDPACFVQSKSLSWVKVKYACRNVIDSYA